MQDQINNDTILKHLDRTELMMMQLNNERKLRERLNKNKIKPKKENINLNIIQQ